MGASAVAEALAAARRPQRCVVGRALDAMDKADAALIEEALQLTDKNDPNYVSGAALIPVFRAGGQEVKKDVISRHRGGSAERCACRK